MMISTYINKRIINTRIGLLHLISSKFLIFFADKQTLNQTRFNLLDLLMNLVISKMVWNSKFKQVNTKIF